MAEKCGSCYARREGQKVQKTSFTVHGVIHAVPDLWLSGRQITYGDQRDAMVSALLDWVEQCELEQRWTESRCSPAR